MVAEPADPSTYQVAESASARRGLGAVMIATAVAGAAGYAIQGAVPLFIGGPVHYVTFSVFWSTLYLVISAISGLQQEVTRAASPAPSDGAVSVRRGLGRFTAGAMVLVAVVLCALGAVLGPILFVGSWPALVPALILGCTAYAGIAVLSGVLYGLSIWWAVATTTVVDAVLRLALVLAVCLIAPTQGALAFAVVLPFPITALTMWLLLRRQVVGGYQLDVPLRRLAANSASTIAASIAIGVMTSGFSAVITMTTPHAERASLGALLFALTLTRAPLVVPMLALQSFLTVRFRDQRGSALRLLLRLGGIVGAAALAGSVLAWMIVPPVISLIWPQYSVSGPVAAGAILSAGATALLCVSGPAVLASSSHRSYLAGWAAAAVVLAGALLLPLPLELRVLHALTIGPVVGMAIQLASLLRSRRNVSRMS